MPPLKSLQAFEAAARLLSFKRAAAELGVTPTAVSHQIRLLERHCGQSLFRRRPRPLSLTPAGRQLFPVLRDGFEAFAGTLSGLRRGEAASELRVTCTNAFAARWLVPRVSNWRLSHPDFRLDIIGTDTVVDLEAGEADLAIRYARKPPVGLISVELMRDSFLVVGSPRLIGSRQLPLDPVDVASLPLIDIEWPATDAEAPTWRRWQTEAASSGMLTPDLSSMPTLSFREEAHGIEAAVKGQGLAICSDVLVGNERSTGALIQISPLRLAGYGFHIAHRAKHPKIGAINAFIDWAQRSLSNPA
ncbi:LysR substrate-binding domain-containing protein [Bosea sp. PAMC 26642]|uniref:LysR substrate-binding domain-containing protein n=1 Tax=Bosea sp. (strain PAMC 26642) TaxID=1792307 RepID=UPI000AB7F888|nr:LysR substrate-binding domain-containing protein [Bosea sp. PAMC 26642]